MNYIIVIQPVHGYYTQFLIIVYNIAFYVISIVRLNFNKLLLIILFYISIYTYIIFIYRCTVYFIIITTIFLLLIFFFIYFNLSSKTYIFKKNVLKTLNKVVMIVNKKQ